jgi:KDO2-lipid IV(A) lauroyltransferase
MPPAQRWAGGVLASPSYRRRMRDNMRQAGVASTCARPAEAGKSMFELPFIWCAEPARVSRHATLENWELVQTELDAGRGIVF